MKPTIIAQAAEALIIQQEDEVIKRRIKKSYRLPILDEKLRKLRTRSEAKLLEKSSKLISVPKVLSINENSKEIKMQFIQGKKLSEHLDKLKNKFEVAEKIGQEIAKLHDNNIIHGDLTTSNMILVENENNTLIKKYKKYNDINNKNQINNSEIAEQEASDLARQNIIKSTSQIGSKPMREANFKIFFIDFGLGFISSRIEDKAVDLHLLRQALEAKHFLHWQKLFKAVLLNYNSKDREKILSQLKKVEKRGRYK